MITVQVIAWAHLRTSMTYAAAESSARSLPTEIAPVVISTHSMAYLASVLAFEVLTLGL